MLFSQALGELELANGMPLQPVQPGGASLHPAELPSWSPGKKQQAPWDLLLNLSQQLDLQVADAWDPHLWATLPQGTTR